MGNGKVKCSLQVQVYPWKVPECIAFQKDSVITNTKQIPSGHQGERYYATGPEFEPITLGMYSIGSSAIFVSCHYFTACI